MLSQRLGGDLVPAELAVRHGRNKKAGPVENYFSQLLPMQKGGMSRDGCCINAADLQRFEVRAAWAFTTEQELMDIEENLEGRYERVAKLWGTYKDQLDNFRGQVKNDCASLDAQARKVAESAHKMNQAFSEVALTLTSADMLAAIENAERLATALSALNGLTPHKIMFATVDTKGA